MRAFIVGNGESLKYTNLNKLIGEITFACNNIHLIYPYTDWRPAHYVRAEDGYHIDESSWMESMKVHIGLDCEIWCNDFFFRPKFGLEGEHRTIKACTHYQWHFDNPDAPHLLHLPLLCTFGSSVNVAVQIAMLQKYSPVYLVGCDLDGGMKHFTDTYRHGKEQENRFALCDALAAHMIAARSGYEIYNATVGGNLEVFPRVQFDEVFDAIPA